MNYIGHLKDSTDTYRYEDLLGVKNVKNLSKTNDMYIETDVEIDNITVRYK